MSLSDRRSILAGLGAFLALPACQMQPALGTGGSLATLQGRTRVRKPFSQLDFLMTQRLEERLGRAPEGAPFALSYSLSFNGEGLGTDRGGSSQRVQLIGRASYSLTRLIDGASLTSGEVHNFNGFSPTGNTVSTQAAQNDAQDRLVIMLADEIVERLLLAAPSMSL